MEIKKRIQNKLLSIIKKSKQIDSKAISEVGSSNLLNRDQWIESALKNIPKGNRILDAGAGEQPYRKFCNHLNYISQDFAQYDPETVSQGLQMGNWDYGKLDIISDVTSVPEPDHSFDAILCTEVIEHIINPIEAIKEFQRLLKPSGMLILTAPFCSMTHFAPYHFYSGYSRFFYKEILTKYGFEILEMTENGNYFEYLAQELKRLRSVGIKYSSIEQTSEIKESINHVLNYLHQCSHKDQGSKELLFFGMHILAMKK